jgi:hypothetical protein
MNSTIGFSEFKSEEKNNKKTRKNRDTIKSHKIQKFLDSIDNDEDENSGMYNLPKPPQVQSSKQINNSMNNNAINNNSMNNEQDNNLDNDDEITQENFNNLQATNEYYNKYHNSYIPYYQNASNNGNVEGEKDLLIEKLNYMIQMMEDQQEEKTGHITEELILYSFLGVFMIFVVDSFARAGKYVR